MEVWVFCKSFDIWISKCCGWFYENLISPYVMENCHDQRKIIFRIFSKNFRFSKFCPGRIWTPPCFPNIPTTIEKFFRRFWSEISRFHNFNACFSDLHRSADLWRSIPGTVRARADDLRGAVAYCRHIAQMPDIPLRRLGCPELPPCSGDGIRAHFSGCLSCLSVRAWLQNFRAHKLKAIIS